VGRERIVGAVRLGQFRIQLLLIHDWQGTGARVTVRYGPTVPPERRQALIERCETIGDTLARATGGQAQCPAPWVWEPRPPKLITFPYNTPSQALTCLWERGTVGGRPWTPLLPRRRKK
jgi:hypothetical protein